MSIFSRMVTFFSSGKESHAKVCAVIAAAGQSTRMDGENKILAELCGQPVIVHTLRAFESAEWVDEVIVVCRSEDIVSLQDICRSEGFEKTAKIIAGGQSRMDSVLRGVMECPKDAGFVAIHDGARPLVTPEQIDRVVEAAVESTAATLAVPVKDSIKKVKGGVTVQSIDRVDVFFTQTPQVFDRDLIKAALTKAGIEGKSLTDDCQAVEALGTGVTIVLGSDQNIKITTREDLLVAEAILLMREGL